MKAKKYTKETICELGVFKRDFPSFKVGDTIAVSQRIKEADKERIQVFEGDVIAMHKNGASTTFTIRKIGAGAIPVERIFPFYSPKIESIRFVRHGKVRRAKLYYMRERIGKAARVQEKVLKREEKEQREVKINEESTAE
jgi:large subunit ribosomal protein L19